MMNNRFKQETSSSAAKSVLQIVSTDLFANLTLLFMFLIGSDPQALEMPVEMVKCENVPGVTQILVSKNMIEFAGNPLNVEDLVAQLSDSGLLASRIEIRPQSEESVNASTLKLARQLNLAGASNVVLLMGCAK